RYLGFHFFTVDGGGNPMMYVNLFWVWGHPEVYILVLPAFGVFSEVTATFSGKPLFGYRSMVAATMAICVLSYTVWLHHFFTMGASANVNAFFGVMSMIIAVPTGVKIFNWLFTMYGGRVRFTVPILWTIGFMVTFVLGGLTGVLLAVPPVDWQVHNSLFLVAHFHHVIIPGVIFGAFAGYIYWFPKAFGFKLDERWGRRAFWCWFIGFHVAFMPLYVVGLMGMTRRFCPGSRGCWSRRPVPSSFSPVSAARSRRSSCPFAIVKHSGTSPVIRGTVARSNGPRRRRHLRGILRYCHASPRSTPYGPTSSACSKAGRCKRGFTSRSRCRQTRRPAS